MVESLPVPAWMTDAAGAITFANQRTEEVLGIGPAALQAQGWASLLHPDDLPAFEAALAEAIAAKAPFQRTLRAAARGSAPRWFACHASPRHDAAGLFLGLTGVTHDVTASVLAEAGLREAEARSRTMLDAAPFSVIVIDTETHEILDVNEYACQDYGYSAEEFRRLRIGDIDTLTCPEAIRARGRAHAVRPGTQEFEAQHRRKSGELRDVLVRVQSVLLDGRRVTFGAHLDITGRKADEVRQRLLMRELDHRSRNALAVVQAALRLTPRADAESYARAVEGRVRALARAHTLLAENRWDGAELRALLEAELEPFLAAQRVELAGPPVTLQPAGTQSLAMALHELATNAMKHGALSVPDGRIHVGWSIAAPSSLVLHWVERGGPPLAGPPARSSFGSRLLDTTIRHQLGGKLELRWEAGGLACEIAFPLDKPKA
jgi:PAS domain S-box-containing protein